LKARTAITVFAILAIVALCCHFEIGVARSATWSKVVEFNGSGTEGYYTDDFNCDYPTWRIVWSYVPSPDSPDNATFSFFVYPGEGGSSISDVSQIGTSNTTGDVYVNNQTGTFYGKVDVAYTASYDIVIEQSSDVVPELSGAAIAIAIGAVTVTILLLSTKAIERRMGKALPEIKDNCLRRKLCTFDGSYCRAPTES
jgi:hypothetical protein